MCFAGVGIWHPDYTTLAKIRDAIIENPSGWKKAAEGKPFRSIFNLSGDSLRRGPKGYDPDHPLIGDLKRKDFIGITTLTQKAVTSPEFPREFADICKKGPLLSSFSAMQLDCLFRLPVTLENYGYDYMDFFC